MDGIKKKQNNQLLVVFKINIHKSLASISVLMCYCYWGLESQEFYLQIVVLRGAIDPSERWVITNTKIKERRREGTFSF